MAKLPVPNLVYDLYVKNRGKIVDEIEFYYTKGDFGSRLDPPSPPEYEIVRVVVDGKELSGEQIEEWEDDLIEALEDEKELRELEVQAMVFSKM